MTKELYIRDSNVKVEVGKKYSIGDNKLVEVLQITPPHKPSSTGRVYIKYDNGSTAEYFPTVIDAEWREAIEAIWLV